MNRIETDWTKRFSIVLCALVLAATCSQGQPKADDSGEQRVQGAVVYLVATADSMGIDGSVVRNGLRATGTGFLVSDNGFLITTYHLLHALGSSAISKSVRVYANVGSKVSDEKMQLAQILDASRELDLLMLRLPGAEAVPPVILGRADRHRPGDRIVLQGFPADAQNSAIRHDATISAADGLGGNTWSMSIGIEEGASGSPVHNERGEVIGIAKGDNDGNIGYFIPIELADALLAHIRFKKILAAQVVLGRRMEWKINLNPVTVLGQRVTTVNVIYDKFIPGYTHALTASFEFEAEFENTTNSKIRRDDLDPIKERRTAVIDDITGTFEFKDVWNRLQAKAQGHGTGYRLSRLKVHVDVLETNDGSPVVRGSAVLNLPNIGGS